MELKDFVSKTIVQITEGIVKARQALSEQEHTKDVRVAPLIRPAGDNPDILLLAKFSDDAARVWPLKFDVAIAVTAEDDVNEGDKLTVGLSNLLRVNLGSTKTHTDKNIEEARLNFVIPILWPSDKALPQDPMTARRKQSAPAD